jgi:ribosomal protein S18
MRRPGASPPHRLEVSVAEVRAGLDFRNTELLRHLVSESGRLRPRRETRLPRGLQRRGAKAVKLARMMALMPFEMVVGDGGGGDTRRRMLEYEAARRSHKLAAGLGGRGGGGGAHGSGGFGARGGGRGGGGGERGGRSGGMRGGGGGGGGGGEP